jgi:hypothetical protein
MIKWVTLTVSADAAELMLQHSVDILEASAASGTRLALGNNPGSRNKERWACDVLSSRSS